MRKCLYKRGDVVSYDGASAVIMDDPYWSDTEKRYVMLVRRDSDLTGSIKREDELCDYLERLMANESSDSMRRSSEPLCDIYSHVTAFYNGCGNSDPLIQPTCLETTDLVCDGRTGGYFTNDDYKVDTSLTTDRRAARTVKLNFDI